MVLLCLLIFFGSKSVLCRSKASEEVLTCYNYYFESDAVLDDASSSTIKDVLPIEVLPSEGAQAKKRALLVPPTRESPSAKSLQRSSDLPKFSDEESTEEPQSTEKPGSLTCL